MQRRFIIGLSLALTMLPLAACAQGLSEFGAVQAGAAGLGAGLAASQNSRALVRGTYEGAVQAQQALMAQNRAVQQYLAMGQAFEAKKQWASAEQAFKYVLQVICKRDGPGSEATVPALKHLVVVSKGQNKLDQAIGFQKTVVAFAHAARKPDTTSLLKAESDLTDMYIQKGDYASAEPVLHEAVELQARVPTVTPAQHTATLKVYGRVLRELNRIEEADAIEASLQISAHAAEAAAAASASVPVAAPATVSGAQASTPAAAPAALSRAQTSVPASTPSLAPVSPTASTSSTDDLVPAPVATATSSPNTSTAAVAATAATSPSTTVTTPPAASAPTSPSTTATTPVAPSASISPSTTATTPLATSATTSPSTTATTPVATSATTSPSTTTSTTTTAPAPKADTATLPAGEKINDQAASQAPSQTTNEMAGEKPGVPEPAQKATAVADEKPVQPGLAQPTHTESSQSQPQSSDQSIKQPEKAN